MHAGHRRAARWSRTHPDIGRAFVRSPSWHVVWGIEPPPPAHRTSMLHGGATVELVAGQAELGHVSKRRSAMVSASRTRARKRPAPVLCARGSRPIAPMGLARTPANDSLLPASGHRSCDCAWPRGRRYLKTGRRTARPSCAALAWRFLARVRGPLCRASPGVQTGSPVAVPTNAACFWPTAIQRESQDKRMESRTVSSAAINSRPWRLWRCGLSFTAKA